MNCYLPEKASVCVCVKEVCNGLSLLYLYNAAKLLYRASAQKDEVVIWVILKIDDAAELEPFLGEN